MMAMIGLFEYTRTSEHAEEECHTSLYQMLLVWCLLLIVGVISFRGPHHPKGHHHYKPRADGPKLTQDTQLLQDAQHIQEDLGDTLPVEAVDKMTPEEMEFHYFKLHDFDNNTKLDGLEILHAIRHTLEHEQYKQDRESNAQLDTPNYKKTTHDLTNFVDLIDQVLYEDDTDHDGYLSYVEYVVGRQRDLQRKAQLTKQHIGS